ncbi:unnamed protein product [Polarella glacialis]|uniref:Peptidase S59 domain-containing protein n=1 Tax=Polarella glacialis TaxID=89957 RepID=A0A813HZW5_POLGL|nr:unnamed protein product [Polarella glacialis]
MFSSNKISLLTVSVNNKNSSKTSNKQQKRQLIGEKCEWNQPYVLTSWNPRCFPPGEAVIDEDNMDYKNKIQKMTEENSACTFLDYNCQTGIWKFEVDHF